MKTLANIAAAAILMLGLLHFAMVAERSEAALEFAMLKK